MYYVVIITCLESRNYKVLENVLKLENNKTFNRGSYYSESNLLIEVCNHMVDLIKDYDVFFPENNYKYPLSEYVYKELQPLIDDFLYVGDEYPEIFISTEILISFFYAINNYSEDENQVWGPLGKYSYQIIYTKKQIETFPIYKVIEKLNLYTNIPNKEDFIRKYNEFLSRHYF